MTENSDIQIYDYVVLIHPMKDEAEAGREPDIHTRGQILAKDEPQAIQRVSIKDLADLGEPANRAEVVLRPFPG